MTAHLKIHPIPILKDNYVWTLINTEKNTAVIVDPGEGLPVHQFLQQHQLILKSILITHHHWDHTHGIMDLKKWHDPLVFGPANENIPGLTYPLHDQQPVIIENFPVMFNTMAIPGHTLGHIAYYGDDMLFCGDTLFAAGCGRIFEGTAEEMYSSLQKIARLPETTQIYCAHEYTLNNLRFAQIVEPNNPAIIERLQQVHQIRNKNLPSLPSTLAEEKTTNPFLRCDSSELIQQVENHTGQSLKNPIAVFASLRKWKDQF